MSTRPTQLFDLGMIGMAKILEDSEDGGPVLQIFAGAEDGGTPCIIIAGEAAALEAFIKIGRALSAWNQDPRRVSQSSSSGALTIDPV